MVRWGAVSVAEGTHANDLDLLPYACVLFVCVFVEVWGPGDVPQLQEVAALRSLGPGWGTFTVSVTLFFLKGSEAVRLIPNGHLLWMVDP